MSINKSDSPYFADLTTPFCGLNVAKPFSLLTSKEKMYTHWLNKSSWAGARILQGQWTSSAAKLYDLLIAIFSNGEAHPELADLKALKAKAGLTDEEWDALLQYASQVYLVSSSVLN
jgi:dipeptidyl-peptidase-3